MANVRVPNTGDSGGNVGDNVPTMANTKTSCVTNRLMHSNLICFASSDLT